MKATSQTIIPHLWYNTEAAEAARFYASIFPESTAPAVATLHDTPSGDTDVVSFTLWGQKFSAISAGPLFSFNPSISFFVNFDPSRMGEKSAREMIDEVWEKLSEGGTALMPIDRYPFSERFGWIQDRYGLSWQLILTSPEGDPRPPIVPSMLFVGENCGRAEEAIDFYLSVFRNSQQGNLVRYGAGQEPDREGTLMFADFMVEGTWFAAMDSAHEHNFSFNEAVSFMIRCEDQKEIDYYWEKLSAVPEAEQCGWLKDRFGVSWQVVPTALDQMLGEGTGEQIARVVQAFLPMKKFDVAALYRAYEGDK